MDARRKLPLDDATSEDLAAGLRDGGDGAFEEALRRYGGQMLRTASRLLGNQDEARDCVQETFLIVIDKIGTFEGRSDLGTWMHRILINVTLGKLRKRKRQNEGDIDTLLPDFDAGGCRIEPRWYIPSTEELLEQRETKRLVHTAMARLPDDYRTVLMLRDIEGYSTAETASLLNATEGAVKTRLHRARAALKRLLEPLYQGGRP